MIIEVVKNPLNIDVIGSTPTELLSVANAPLIELEVLEPEAIKVIEVTTNLAPIMVEVSTVGTQGNPGISGSSQQFSGPAFTYTGDALTRIDYDDGSYKVLGYSNGLLTRVDLHVNGQSEIKRKDFLYSNGILTNINETVV